MVGLIRGLEWPVMLGIRPRGLLVLFFLSGFVGLLTEQVFERLLSVVVGGATPAAAIVLSVYFAGIAMGGWIATRIVGRASFQSIRAYGLAELAVAVWCLAVLSGFDSARHWFGPILVWAAGVPSKMFLVRILIASAVVLPASLAMGLSFPFLSEMAYRISTVAGVFLARLYTVNLLGAAAAAVLAPYAIFPFTGLNGGLALGAVIDGIVALVALGAAVPNFTGSPAASVSGVLKPAPKARHLPLLAIAFGSGFVFFMLEVLWTHIVAVVNNSSIYAFSSMLFFVTLGLAMGARAQGRFLATRNDNHLGFLLLASAGVLLFQTAFWPDLPFSMAGMGHDVESFYLGEAIRWLHAALMLLPVTFIYGMIYPALFADSRFGKDGAGAMIGYMSAANAAGCVLGALAASFYLIPAFGSEHSLRAIVCVLAVLGAAGALIDGRDLRAAIPVAAALVVLAVLLPGWNPKRFVSGLNVDFRGTFVGPESRLLFLHEDAYGGVTSVIENDIPGLPRGRVRTLMTNAKFQGDDFAQVKPQVAFAAIPALHAARRSDALVIGLGTGQTAGVLRELGFSHLEVADLSPGIILASGQFFGHINYGVVVDPAVVIHREDGRNVLLAHTKKYDLITVEISSVWFAGATNLYSKEFYDLARSRLNPDGIFQQWIQFHHIGPREIDSIIGSLRAAFPYVSVWYFGGQGMLVASAQPQLINREAEDALWVFARRQPSTTADSPQKFLDALRAARVLDADGVTRLSATRPFINHDWNRWLEYSTPKYNLSTRDWISTNLAHLQQYASAASASRH
jgi:spermidine synthase